MFGGNEELLGAWFELEEHPLKVSKFFNFPHFRIMSALFIIFAAVIFPYCLFVSCVISYDFSLFSNLSICGNSFPSLSFCMKCERRICQKRLMSLRQADVLRDVWHWFPSNSFGINPEIVGMNTTLDQ